MFISGAHNIAEHGCRIGIWYSIYFVPVDDCTVFAPVVILLTGVMQVYCSAQCIILGVKGCIILYGKVYQEGLL
jgi:hypothetical protein